MEQSLGTNTVSTCRPVGWSRGGWLGWLLIGMASCGLGAAMEPNVPTDPNVVALDLGENTDFLNPDKRPDIIRSLEFEGNKKFKNKVLKQRVGIELGARFDPFLAEGGRRTILEVYRKIGYNFVEAEWDRELAKQGKLLYTIVEGSRVRIKKITVKGTKVYSARSLKKLLRTRKRKWYGKKVYFTEQAVREDGEKLRDFYYRRGYLGYQVSTDTEFTSDRKYAIVTFTIEEGPPYTIERIVFNGNTLTTDEMLRDQIEIEVGAVYRRDKASRDAKRMVDEYRERGFIDAEVVQGPILNEDIDKRVVTVNFVIQEGHQFRIGQIDVSGNDLGQDKVARRVLDEYGFTPGELYNGKIASGRGDSLLENYVKRASLAEEVVIRPVPAASGDPNQKDVRVDMTEGMTGMIMPGVGISSDDGLIGQLIYQQRNFDISDWPQSWKDFFTMQGFRGAGQSLRIALEPGTQVSRYSLEFSDPYFRDKPMDFTLAVRSFERWWDAYDEGRIAGSVGFEHRTWGQWSNLGRQSHLINFRAENVQITDIASDAPISVRNVQGNNHLYSVTLGTGLQDLDDIYMPTEGFNFRVAGEFATGQQSFSKLTSSFVWHYPLYEDILERRTVFSSRLQGGYAFGETPVFERFYGGGMGRYAVRGFDFRGISPRGISVDDNGNRTYNDIYAVGSKWIFTAGNEITIPIIEKNFSGIVFLDAGVVQTGGWRLSSGVGLQILVPQWFGPVPMRFEYGYPIRSDDSDETRRFNFSMGAMF
ncbi:outer membrane protein assembly factor BamA [Planctomycetota bacterium]